MVFVILVIIMKWLETQYANKLHKKTFTLEVYDHDLFKDRLIGSLTIDLHAIATGCEAFDLPIFKHNKTAAGRIQFRCYMEEINDVGIWFRRIGIEGLENAVSPCLEYYFDSSSEPNRKDDKDMIVSVVKSGSDPEWIDCLEVLIVKNAVCIYCFSFSYM